jgi:hypothetical protein
VIGLRRHPRVALLLALALFVSSVRADSDQVYRIVLSAPGAPGATDVALHVAPDTYDTRAAAEAALAQFEATGQKGWIAAEPRDNPAMRPSATVGIEAAAAPVTPIATPSIEPAVAEDTEAIAQRLATLAPETPNAAVVPSQPLGLVAAVRLALERQYGLLVGEAAESARQSIDAAALAQVLEPDDVAARDRVKQLLQASYEDGQEGRALDTVLTTAKAYLNVLRSEALLDIEREDLKRSDSSYERARSRLAFGAANRAEVYGWQTTRANSQARVVNAEAATKRACIELDRTMNQPLGSQFVATTPTPDEPYFLVSTPAIRDALATPSARPRLREFFVEESLTGSPELKHLRSEIEAQQRRLMAYNRGRHVHGQETGIVFRAPATGRFAEYTGNTDAGGAQLASTYRVGEDRRHVQADLDALRMRYEDALTRLRAQVLRQAVATEAAYDAIADARIAAEAGRTNLAAVTEAYERGAVPMTDVTDAQNLALTSDQNATNALYDFLIGYMELQRSTGQFDLIATDADRAAMRKRLEAALTR